MWKSLFNKIRPLFSRNQTNEITTIDIEAPAAGLLSLPDELLNHIINMLTAHLNEHTAEAEYQKSLQSLFNLARTNYRLHSLVQTEASFHILYYKILRARTICRQYPYPEEARIIFPIRYLLSIAGPSGLTITGFTHLVVYAFNSLYNASLSIAHSVNKDSREFIFEQMLPEYIRRQPPAVLDKIYRSVLSRLHTGKSAAGFYLLFKWAGIVSAAIMAVTTGIELRTHRKVGKATTHLNDVLTLLEELPDITPNLLERCQEAKNHKWGTDQAFTVKNILRMIAFSLWPTNSYQNESIGLRINIALIQFVLDALLQELIRQEPIYRKFLKELPEDTSNYSAEDFQRAFLTIAAATTTADADIIPEEAHDDEAADEALPPPIDNQTSIATLVSCLGVMSQGRLLRKSTTTAAANTADDELPTIVVESESAPNKLRQRTTRTPDSDDMDITTEDYLRAMLSAR